MTNYRDAFPDFSPTVYLDCAYQGPFPLATGERVREALELKLHPDRLTSPDYFELPERVRARLARLLGAEPAEIALTSSATQGIGIVAAGLKLEPGDEVVIAESNFPANLFSWLHLRRLGVRVRVLKPVDGAVRLEDVAAALTSRTRVVALDWVSYTTGVQLDLAALGETVHQRGGLLVLDGTQGVGALELAIHALPVDALVAAGYKWLLGPYGMGFAYLGRTVQERLDLPVINWLSVEGSEDFKSLPLARFTLPHEARVFDIPETGNFLNISAFEASLEFVEAAGVGNVTAHCRRLLDRLEGGLTRKGYRVVAAARPSLRSTILAFQAASPEATEALYTRLREHHIAVSLRHGFIRVSPYLYNTDEEIGHVIDLVPQL
jgi:selenocysteine lyase/cysteine desulfurase